MSQRPAILVTGGAGYIGAHCCKALSEAGYVPVCFDNLSTGHRHFVKWGPLVEGDVGDTQRVADAIAAHAVVAVMHFAAFKSVGESVLKPLEYYRNNIDSLITVLEVMKDNKVKDFIFSSSCTVYGQPDQIPVNENGDTIQPIGTGTQ